MVGTSGYNYTKWKGSFYTEKLSSKKMLPFDAALLPTVEINYTFYRMPTERLLAGWSEVTPDYFRFTLKAPQRIIHEERLWRSEETTADFRGAGQTLGVKLGVLLFQLPPSFNKDLAVFDDFVVTLQPGVRAAFQFRHTSWHDAKVFERLRARRLALCGSDSDRLTTPVEITAADAYFRLRDEGYQTNDITGWAATIAAGTAACRDVFMCFKHEDQGNGPEFTRLLIETLAASV